MRIAVKYLIDAGALVLLYVFVLSGRWKARGRECLLVNTLLYLYLALVLYVTLMPVITAIPFVLNHPYRPMNLVPFIDVQLGRGDFLRQIVLNVIMTVPFGFLFPLTRNRAGGLIRTVGACFLMSLGIEMLQPLLSGSRSADVTDLMTNVTGGVLGYGIYAVFRPVTFWVLDHLCPRR